MSIVSLQLHFYHRTFFLKAVTVETLALLHPYAHNPLLWSGSTYIYDIIILFNKDQYVWHNKYSRKYKISHKIRISLVSLHLCMMVWFTGKTQEGERTGGAWDGWAQVWGGIQEEEGGGQYQSMWGVADTCTLEMITVCNLLVTKDETRPYGLLTLTSLRLQYQART